MYISDSCNLTIAQGVIKNLRGARKANLFFIARDFIHSERKSVQEDRFSPFPSLTSLWPERDTFPIWVSIFPSVR